MSSSWSRIIEYFAEHPFFKSSNAVSETGYQSLSKDSVYIQLIIFPAAFNIVQIRHLIPACVPLIESTSSIISIVHCWFGVTGNRARWFFKKSCHGDNNKLQIARGVSWELSFNFWTSFTVKVTESDPKSRDRSKPSLETEKFMLL